LVLHGFATSPLSCSTSGSVSSLLNAEHAGGRLTIRFEQPDALRLYLRFTYETTLSEAGAPGEVVQVSEFIKSAYRQSDLDTVRIIRMIAATGRPH